MEHVTDPAVNYYPMYSIEYRPRHNPYEGTFPMAWAQFTLTQSIWLARLLAVENWLRHSKHNMTRVRVL